MNKTEMYARAMFVLVSITFLLVAFIWSGMNVLDGLEKEQNKYYYIAKDGTVCYKEYCRLSACDLAECSDGMNRNQATDYLRVRK